MSVTHARKCPVTLTAVVGRINRRLAHEEPQERLHKARSWDSNVGWYYIVDTRSVLVASHVDPEVLARDLGVLADHEEVVG